MALAGLVFAGGIAGGAFVLSSTGDEEEIAQQVQTAIPGNSASPAATATPTSATQAASPTPSSPTPQVSPGPLTMEGPTEARAGDTLTYRLSYTFPEGRGSGIIIAIPRSVQYISSRLARGEGEVTKEPDAETIDLRWLLIGTGLLEVTVRVPESTTSRSIVMGASGPGGSAIPPNEQIASNIVTTTVSGP
jgi:hypothetical protein